MRFLKKVVANTKRQRPDFGKTKVAASFSALLGKMAIILKQDSFLKKWQDAVLEPSDYEKDEYGDDTPIGPDWSDLIGEVYKYVGLGSKDHIRVYNLEDPAWKKTAGLFLDKRFKEFAKEFAAAQSEGGKMIAWRCIGTGLKPLIEKLKRGEAPSTGIFWAWTEKGAFCYWKKNSKTEVMLKALIPLASIDIERTLIQNLSPFHYVETEIRVNEGAPLEVVEVKKKGAEKAVKVKPTKVSACA